MMQQRAKDSYRATLKNSLVTKIYFCTSIIKIYVQICINFELKHYNTYNTEWYIINF